jgi:hypothetical protein
MVVYILCYDYSTSPDIQNSQLSYWFDFLQSTLSISSFEAKSKWQVVVVGTKSDKCTSKPKQFSLPIPPSWKVQWPNLSFFNNQFIVSSHNLKGISLFLSELNQICHSIIEQNYLLVPRKYNKLLDSIKSIPQDQCIMPTSQLEASFSWGDHNQFQLALKYFHAIGQVVLLHNSGLICVSPQVIPKITAEFISPESVRHKLLRKHRVTIMNKSQIGAVLEVSEENKEYALCYSF